MTSAAESTTIAPPVIFLKTQFSNSMVDLHVVLMNIPPTTLFVNSISLKNT